MTSPLSPMPSVPSSATKTPSLSSGRTYPRVTCAPRTQISPMQPRGRGLRGVEGEEEEEAGRM